MNLYPDTKKAYIVILCFIIAMIYALLIGIQPIPYRIADGLIYGAVLFMVNILLWNTCRFIFPSLPIFQRKRNMELVLLPVFITVILVGVESAGMYLCFPANFGWYGATIPIRLFVSFLLLVISLLFYVLYLKKETGPEAIKATTDVTVERITVRNGQRIKIIPVDNIIFVKADGDYVMIYTAEGKWLKEQTMKNTEEMLPPDKFVRTHRSYIVNITYISRIERFGNQHQVVLSNGEKIKLSNARFQLLKQSLGI